jgi:hypothetical protein
VAVAVGVEIAVALGLEVVLEVAVVVAVEVAVAVAVAVGVAVAVAVAVGGASEDDSGSGSTIEEVVSRLVVVWRVPAACSEGDVRSIRTSGGLLSSNNLPSHCIPVIKVYIKAAIVASTNTACNSPKKYLPTPEYGLKTTRSA